MVFKNSIQKYNSLKDQPIKKTDLIEV
jgi:hypothetical protein